MEPRATPTAAALTAVLLAAAVLAGAPSAAGGTATGPPAGDGSTTPSSGISPAAALREGNRLARRGEPEAAVEAFLRPGPEAVRSAPLLAYNLATTLHRLGKLPEAVLWYRRAGSHLGSEPWLEQNLERARRRLAARGAERRAPAGAVARLVAQPRLLPTLATGAAWSALVLALLGLRGRSGPAVGGRLRRGAAVLLGVGALLWGAHIAAGRLGPRPAVLLAPCGPSLPEGSEVWVRSREEGGYTVLPSPTAPGRRPPPAARCPEEAVAVL